MLPPMAAALMLGCVMGASAVGTFADGTVNTLLAEHRSEWLGFWGAIIGAVISGMISVAAAFYAAISAWKSVNAQIESDKQIARSNTDRMSQIITRYCRANYSVAGATFAEMKSIQNDDDGAKLKLAIRDYDKYMHFSDNRPIRDYIYSRMDTVHVDIVPTVLATIRTSQDIDALIEEMGETLKIGALDGVKRQNFIERLRFQTRTMEQCVAGITQFQKRSGS